MQDIHEEHAVQAFTNLDKNDRGFITTLQFYDILTTIKPHLITPFVKENIVTVSVDLEWTTDGTMEPVIYDPLLYVSMSIALHVEPLSFR